MSHYNQLTAIERGRIESFIQLGLSLHEIATRLSRSVSTISREVHRCTKEYKALAAQKDYLKKRKACRRPRIFENAELRSSVIKAIQDDHCRQNRSSETTYGPKDQVHSASSQSIEKYIDITLVYLEVMVLEALHVNCVTEVRQGIRKATLRKEERFRFHTNWRRDHWKLISVLGLVTGNSILLLVVTVAMFLSQ